MKNITPKKHTNAGADIVESPPSFLTFERDGLLYVMWRTYPSKGMAENQIDYFQGCGLKSFFHRGKFGYMLFVEAIKGREKYLF